MNTDTFGMVGATAIAAIAAMAACAPTDVASSEKAPPPTAAVATSDAGDAELPPAQNGTPMPGAAHPDIARDVPTVSSDCGTFPAITDITAPGPFGSVAVAEGPDCTIVRPTSLGQGGVRHPVIVWGNGTDGPVALYEPGLERWASHGFIVAAANMLNGQGAGASMLACLDYVLAQATTAGSAYEGKVCARAGAAGHSQGGGGALMAGRDPRIVATAPLQPYTAQGYGGFDRASFTAQVGPMLLLSGSLDDNATPSIHQQPVFDATNVPVIWATLLGADHYTTALGLPKFREPMLAWFRLQLLGDEAFRGMFYGASCTLCADPAWAVQRRGIP